MSQIQAIIFDKKKWTASKARNWLKKNRFKPLKAVHKTENYLRYRLKTPSKNLDIERNHLVME